MKIRAVLFPEAGKIEFTERELATEPLEADAALVENECTVVSAGTELAVLAGSESWAVLPFVPGYGAVGRVRAVGPGLKGIKEGDRVFYHGPHQSHAIAKRFILPVPEGLEPERAVMARMGQVAFTSVRAGGMELGDRVAVQGLGLVGNFAAQLAGLAGATAIGIDISESRLATAKTCGVPHGVNPKTRDVVEAVREITGGGMCDVVVEATGIPDQAVSAAKLAATGGRVVLLGTPRGEFHGDGADLLRRIHLANFNVTFTGGHEWRYPMKASRETRALKHSIERNVGQLLAFIRDGRLKVRELTSHILPPERCADVYQALRSRDENYVGVVFDWRKQG